MKETLEMHAGNCPRIMDRAKTCTCNDTARAIKCMEACANIPDPAAAIALAVEAIEKIRRHVPDHGGCSLSDDLDLCKRALAALNGKA